MTENPQQVTSASGPGGAIYDIGYRRYAGPRLGRPFAVRSLFAHTARGAFGIGRGGRAKIVPFGLLVILMIPALVSLGVGALAGGAAEQFDPIKYQSYYSITQAILFLFIAAQAPELVGPDQRNKVLPLYFSRPILRSDYAFAKLAALIAALMLFSLAPQALLFFGRILQAPDIGDGISKNIGSFLPILATACALSVFYAAIGLAISAFTPRRAYATAAIIGLFIAMNAGVGILWQLLRGDARRFLALFSVETILSGAAAFFFGEKSENMIVRRADLPGWVYLLAVAVVAGACIGLLFRRYHVVET